MKAGAGWANELKAGGGGGGGGAAKLGAAKLGAKGAGAEGGGGKSSRALDGANWESATAATARMSRAIMAKSRLILREQSAYIYWTCQQPVAVIRRAQRVSLGGGGN